MDDDDSARDTGERRTDPHRLSDRVAALEKQVDKLEQLAVGMNYALFGLPQDRENNGLVGEMRNLRKSLDRFNARTVGLLLTVLGAIIADVVSRHG